MARSTTKERQLNQALLSRIENVESALAIATYGEEAIFDNELGLVLARQLRFEGAGVNSSSTNGNPKRFNGGQMLFNRGLFSRLGMVIVEGNCTTSNTEAGRTIELVHSNANGENRQQVFSFPLDLIRNRFGYFENQRIFIPGERRFTYWMEGESFAYPQLRIAYRKVLEIL